MRQAIDVAIGFLVLGSFGFLLFQMAMLGVDAWRRREYRRAVEVVQARNLRLFSRPMDFPFPPNQPASTFPRGEYPALKFPDRPIIPTRDAHFGETDEQSDRAR